MRGRVGVVLVVGLFAAGLAAGAIQAGPTAPPTIPETTTEQSTEEATTSVSTATTTTTTLTPTPTTTIAPAPPVRHAISAGSPIDGGACVLLAAFALLDPTGQTRVLGQAAQASHANDVVARDVAYPADGSILTASSVGLHAGACEEGRAAVRSVSLFDGAVTARSVELGVHRDVVGKSLRVDGLTVHGRAVVVRAGRPLSLGNWSYAIALPQPDRTGAAALAVHLTKAHAGLSAGTTLLVSFVQLPRRQAAAPKTKSVAKPRARAHVQHTAKPPKRRTAKPPKRRRRHVRKRLGDDPLKLTPPLGLSRYTFPVAGDSSNVDTYGAFRGDVPGNWHHGDDIFAPLGAPVVAVADGTLNRVGWEHLGGWRLWVRDTKRNEFYYAHLSGYSPLALHSRHVKAGDVIGFIGNTGDAFTTPPHLHFEIHPHQLLRLDYNGAVNPTGYLDAWQHVARPSAPVPAHPPFPPGAVRAEARFVWRQLLAARGLISHAPQASERPHIKVPGIDRFPTRRIAAAAGGVHPVARASGLRPLDALMGLVAPALLFLSALVVRLRRRPS
jgi:murein DD-endopeptidase MepM/ murein hydrolase activator NlpD